MRGTGCRNRRSTRGRAHGSQTLADVAVLMFTYPDRAGLMRSRCMVDPVSRELFIVTKDSSGRLEGVPPLGRPGRPGSTTTLSR